VHPTWRRVLLIFPFDGKFDYWVALDVAYLVLGMSFTDYSDSHYILQMCEQKTQHSTLAKTQNKIPPSLQTTRKKNNWKTEETLAKAVVTLETERIKESNP
jgi:hypothetical protein